MNSSDLKVVRRDHPYTGKRNVAPSIRGWVIWDIPEEHWVEEVQAAILHAYEVGYKHGVDKVVSDAQRMGKEEYGKGYVTKWPELEDEEYTL